MASLSPQPDARRPPPLPRRRRRLPPPPLPVWYLRQAAAHRRRREAECGGRRLGTVSPYTGLAEVDTPISQRLRRSGRTGRETHGSSRARSAAISLLLHAAALTLLAFLLIAPRPQPQPAIVLVSEPPALPSLPSDTRFVLQIGEQGDAPRGTSAPPALDFQSAAPGDVYFPEIRLARSVPRAATAAEILGSLDPAARPSVELPVEPPREPGVKPPVVITPVKRPKGTVPAIDPHRGQSEAAEAARQGELDELVDLFILSDSDKLHGEACDAAEARIDALGQDAIAPLVRGYNRAARAKDHCPFRIIGEKLDELLTPAAPPDLLLYALDNLGDGVIPGHPHWQPLAAKRKTWVARVGDKVAEYRELLAAEQPPGRYDLTVHLLADADADQLLVVLGRDNDELRRAAAELLIRRGLDFSDHERIELSAPLIGMLQAEDLELRKAARLALIGLSGGEVDGPPENKLRDDAAEVARWWQSRWTEFALGRNLDRDRAREVLARLGSEQEHIRLSAAAELAAKSVRLSDRQALEAARLLLALLKADGEGWKPAHAALVAIAEMDVPPRLESAADREQALAAWTEHWDAVELSTLVEPRARAFLAMAEALELQGRRDDAKKRYQAIVRDFPKTKAAQEALLRVREMTVGE